MTVLYTTHYMEEADRLCDRIGIIDGGSMIALGTSAELKARIGRGGNITLEEVFPQHDGTEPARLAERIF